FVLRRPAERLGVDDEHGRLACAGDHGGAARLACGHAPRRDRARPRSTALARSRDDGRAAAGRRSHEPRRQPGLHLLPVLSMQRKAQSIAVIVLALLVAGVTLTGWEWLWRQQGHEPALYDDRDLWSLH